MGQNCTLGDLLLAIREEKNISQGELCKGLCSQPELSRIENWTRKPSRLLLNALIQRLGKSLEHFITVLNPEELAYFTWQQNMYDALCHDEKERMRKLLGEKIAQDRSCLHNIQEQFYQYMSAYVEHNCSKMRDALTITLPELKRGISYIRCIGTGEMTLLLLYLEQRLLYENTGEEDLRECIYYLEKNYAPEELVNIYPRAVILLCQNGGGNCYERLMLCKKAFELLRSQLRIQEMPVLLEIMISDMLKMNIQDVKEYQNFLWVFQELYGKYGGDYKKRVSFIMNVQEEKYMLGDLIRKCRNEKKLSREEASRDICDVMTLGRIENRERGTKVKVYQQFTERLDLPYEDIFSAKLVTNNYKCLQVGDEIQSLIRRHEYGELTQKLEWLKAHLDLVVKKNQQYVKMEENSIEYIMGKKNVIEYGNTAREILRLTIPEWDDEYATHFYTGVEIQLVNHIAISYLEQEKYMECSRIIQKMWSNVNAYDYTISMRAKELLSVMTTWARALYCMGKDEEALQLCEKGLKTTIQSGYGDKLDFWICEKCRILSRDPAKVQNIEKLIVHSYKQVYYWALLFGKMDNAEMCRQFLQEWDVTF